MTTKQRPSKEGGGGWERARSCLQITSVALVSSPPSSPLHHAAHDSQPFTSAPLQVYSWGSAAAQQHVSLRRSIRAPNVSRIRTKIMYPLYIKCALIRHFAVANDLPQKKLLLQARLKDQRVA